MVEEILVAVKPKPPSIPNRASWHWMLYPWNWDVKWPPVMVAGLWHWINQITWYNHYEWRDDHETLKDFIANLSCQTPIEHLPSGFETWLARKSTICRLCSNVNDHFLDFVSFLLLFIHMYLLTNLITNLFMEQIDLHKLQPFTNLKRSTISWIVTRW